MIRSIAAFVIILGLAACASSEPQADLQATAVPAQAAAVPQTSESSGETTESGEAIEVVAVPAAAKKAENRARKNDELICRKELILGTHRKEEVCRFRSEIDEERKMTQDVIRRMSLRPRSNRY